MHRITGYQKDQYHESEYNLGSMLTSKTFLEFSYSHPPANKVFSMNESQYRLAYFYKIQVPPNREICLAKDLIPKYYNFQLL